MQLEASVFHGWPAWTLQRGQLALHIVPAVGGRLMGIQYAGTELCFINPLLLGQLASDDPTDWQRLCGDWSFPLWGGGKTWVAPESSWPDGNPQRDLDSGRYRVLETWCDAVSCGLELESSVCRRSGLQVRRRISMRADAAGWTVEHTLINATEVALRYGIWDVLMLRRPGQVAVALDPARGVLAPCREIAGKGQVADLRQRAIVAIDEHAVTVQCRQAEQYKLGVAGASGAIDVQLDLPEGGFHYWRRADTPAAASYAHGHPVEVFNAPELPYFEVESHSPLATIPASGRIVFTVHEGVGAQLPEPSGR